MTNEEAEAMLKQLSAHYNEPVMPVSRYCNALETWGRCVAQNHQNEESELKHLIPQIQNVFMAIRKSNLLARLIYGGEKLRTEKCSTHQGIWSGCTFDDLKCGCLSGANVTGWLPAKE